MQRPERFLVVEADALELTTPGDGQVHMHLKGVASKVGLADDMGLMVSMSASDARRLALMLERMADRSEQNKH